jgi:lipopolysaccharide biosynthesis glycosyltransferase
MRNAIVTAADREYLPAAVCALLSCANEGAVGIGTALFLLAIGCSAAEVDDVRGFLKRQGVSAQVVAIAAERLQPFQASNGLGVATYARLLLREDFDDRWNRLLYLDADVRVMVPLEPLFDVDLAGSPLGAVHDYVQYLISGIDESRRRLSLASHSTYFNAGVLLFDWPVAQRSGLLNRARIFAEEYAHLCTFHDQDALNVAFEGAWAPLDPRWNLLIAPIPPELLRLDYPDHLRANIAHFTGPAKPWMANYPLGEKAYGAHRAWYQNALRGSPWRDFVARPAEAAPESTLKSTKPNPKLQYLLDTVIAEATGSPPARAALRKFLADPAR